MQNMKPNREAAIGFILVTVLVDVIGLGIIIPVAPKLIMELTGEGISTASRYGGWLTFAYALMQFLFAPVLGGLSDRYGRRPVLLLSLLGFGLDYIILALAPSMFWLFLARVLSGMAGASITTASAYVADVSPPDRRAQNFGMIGAAFGLGFIIGPLLGGVLGEFGTRVPFWFAAGLSILNCLYGYFVLPESLKPENRRPFEWKRANPLGSIRQLRRYPSLSGLLVALTFVYLASHAVQSTWSYYNMGKFGWDGKKVGYSLAVVGILVALVQGVLIRSVIPRFGKERSLYMGLTLYAMGMVLYAFATQGWMMYAFSAVYCAGGISGPALQGIISSQVPPNEQGELQGGLTSLMSASAIVGPPLMTNLYSYFTGTAAPFVFHGAPFIAGTLFFLLSALLAYLSLTRSGKAA
jgi:DHA1 family tetracycline resistance protein-like MFS transporter